MKTITLNKTNTKHIMGNTYAWTPDNSEPYNLIVEDDISIFTRGGNISTDGGDIYTCGGDISTDGGNIDTCGGDIDTCGGDIYTGGGNISTDGGNIDCGKLYWRSMQIPKTCGGKITCKIVYPDVCTRSHWVDRLSGIVDVSTGRYAELLEPIRPHMQEILALDKWSQCERWIIESWANNFAGGEG